MRDYLQKNILYSLVPFLLLGSCVYIGNDSEQVYEATIRHYLKDWQSFPDTIVVSIEGEDPSDTLIDQLSDLETTLVRKNDANRPDAADIDNQYRMSLSVRTLRGIGYKTIRMEVSSSTAPFDIYGIEYLHEKKKGMWVVVDEGPEYMSKKLQKTGKSEQTRT